MVGNGDQCRPWQHVADEVNRCRRNGGSFVLIRMTPTAPRLKIMRRPLSWHRRSARHREMDVELPSEVPLRTIDRSWKDGNDQFLLLVDTCHSGAQGFIRRLQELDPVFLGEHLVTVAAFPADGLTCAAILDALDRDAHRPAEHTGS